MSRHRVVPATSELLREFYGCNPAKSVRAIVVLRDEKPVAVGGVYRDGDRFVFYGDGMEYLRANKKTLVASAKIAAEIARQVGGRVQSLADPRVPGSGRLLEHLGFRRLAGDVYEYGGAA